MTMTPPSMSMLSPQHCRLTDPPFNPLTSWSAVSVMCMVSMASPAIQQMDVVEALIIIVNVSQSAVGSMTLWFSPVVVRVSRAALIDVVDFPMSCSSAPVR